MALSDAQILIWENPGAQFYATIPINITLRNSRTFHTPVSIGKDGTPFLFNMWALRNNNAGPPSLIASNHSNTDFPVTWTPTSGDLDIKNGNHQLMWESCLENPFQDSVKLARGQGYSNGFVIKALPSTASSAPSPSATISSTGTASGTTSDNLDTTISTTKISSTATPLKVATPPGIGHPAIIGFSVGCGIIFAVGVMGIILWILYHRKAKANAVQPPHTSPTIHNKDGKPQSNHLRIHEEIGPLGLATPQHAPIYEAGGGRRSPQPTEMPS